MNSRDGARGGGDGGGDDDDDDGDGGGGDDGSQSSQVAGRTAEPPHPAGSVAALTALSGCLIPVALLLATLTRRGAPLCAVLLAAASLWTSGAARSDSLQARQRSLQQDIGADTGALSAQAGRIADLESELHGLQASIAIQQTALAGTTRDLAAAQARLSRLRRQLADDRRVLAAELVAQYESPAPNLVGVVVEAHGFTDLLERVDDMRAVAQGNAALMRRVSQAAARVAAQTAALEQARARRGRALAAVLVERDQATALRLALLQRERVTSADRAAKQAQLDAVSRQLATLQAQAQAAQRQAFAASSATAPPSPAPASAAASAAPDGWYGFFPAPGTNYSVGEEPILVARLNVLGKALHLHLIGLSGYRSPAHSVEVGGFANDPHTRGEASDTPGVEGVPEAVLLRFGLTRPFPGPREADHIQLAP